jgi:hypothetical protein
MPCTGGRELGKLKTKAKYLVMAVSENCQRLCYAKERKGKQKTGRFCHCAGLQVGAVVRLCVVSTEASKDSTLHGHSWSGMQRRGRFASTLSSWLVGTILH